MKRVLIFTALLMGGVLAAPPKVGSLGDLRKIEAEVKKVVRDQTAATISLVSLETGASGSGVIVSADGLILTAAHVVDGNKEMTVLFPDGRQEKAKVLGANYNRDAAMAKLVNAGPWPYAEVRNSSGLEVGDWLVAMGHPKGFDPTRRPPVRFGRVMAKGIFDFITTDCTLIGGDSGGPLFDLEGRVVGIHSHIAPDRRVNNHAGMSGYLASWDKMLAGKKWGILGGNRQDPNRPVMGMILRPTERGMVLEEVTRGGPADTVGLRAGDLIRSVDGELIDSSQVLDELLIDHLPGESIEVKYLRADVEGSTVLKLGRLAEIFQTQRQ